MARNHRRRVDSQSAGCNLSGRKFGGTPMLVMSAIAMLGAQAATAAPATVSSHNPQSIVQFMQDLGYRAKLSKDKVGDPMIESGHGGSNFTIFFYGCEKGVKCADLAFQTGYDADAGKEPSLETVNKFNKDFRWVRAAIDDEKDPTLQMDVIFTDGLMSRKMFEEVIEVWADGMGNFEKAIGW